MANEQLELPFVITLDNQGSVSIINFGDDYVNATDKMKVATEGVGAAVGGMEQTTMSLRQALSATAKGFQEAQGFAGKFGFAIDVAKGFMGGLSEVMAGVNQKFGGFINSFTQSGQAIQQIGMKLTAIFTLITAGAVMATKQALAYAESLWYMHQRTGVSVEDLSALQLAAAKSGVSLQYVGYGMQQLGRNMAMAEKQTSLMAKTFKKYGIELVDVATKQKRNIKDVLMDVSKTLAEMDDVGKKLQVSQILMGRYGRALIPFLNLGPEGLKEAMKAAEELGAVISEKTARAAEDFSGKMEEMKLGLKGVYYQLLDEMLPTLKSYVSWIVEVVKSMNGWIGKHKEAAGAIASTGVKAVLLMTAVSPLIAIFGTLMSTVNNATQVLARYIVNLKGVKDASEAARLSTLAMNKAAAFIGWAGIITLVIGGLVTLYDYLTKVNEYKMHGNPLKEWGENVDKELRAARKKLKEFGDEDNMFKPVKEEPNSTKSANSKNVISKIVDVGNDITDGIDTFANNILDTTEGGIKWIENAVIDASQFFMRIGDAGTKAVNSWFGVYSEEEKKARAARILSVKAFQYALKLSGTTLEGIEKEFGKGEDGVNKFFLAVASGAKNNISVLSYLEQFQPDFLSAVKTDELKKRIKQLDDDLSNLGVKTIKDLNDTLDLNIENLERLSKAGLLTVDMTNALVVSITKGKMALGQAYTIEEAYSLLVEEGLKDKEKQEKAYTLIEKQLKGVHGEYVRGKISLQTYTEQTKKLTLQQALLAIEQGKSLSASQKGAITASYGITTVEEQKTETVKLQIALDSINAEFSRTGNVNKYVASLKALGGAAGKGTDEFKNLIQTTLTPFERSFKNIDEYAQQIITVFDNLKEKQREWADWGKDQFKSWVTGAVSAAKESGKALLDIETELASYDKPVSKKPVTAKTAAYQGAIKLEEARHASVMAALTAEELKWNELYAEKARLIEDYYKNEKIKLDLSLQLRMKDAELDLANAQFRRDLAAESDPKKQADLLAAFKTQAATIGAAYESSLASAKGADQARLLVWKTQWMDPIIKNIVRLKDKEIVTNKEMYARLKELRKKGVGATAEEMDEIKKLHEATATDINFIWSAVFSVAGGIFGTVGQSMADSASRMVENITDDMTYLQKQTIQTKAAVLSSWGQVAVGIGQIGGRISAKFAEIAENNKKSTVKIKATVTDMLVAIGPELAAALGTSIGNAMGAAAGRRTYAAEGSAVGGLVAGIALVIIGGVGVAVVAAVTAVASLLGGILGGLFKKSKTQAEKDAEELEKYTDALVAKMSSYGKITRETAAQVTSLYKEMGKAAAEAYKFSIMIEAMGVNIGNINALWGKSIAALTEYNKGTLKAEEAAESLGKSFDLLLAGAERMGTLGSKSMTTFITTVMQSGLKVKEITDYVYGMLGVTQRGTLSAVQGLQMMIAAAGPGLTKLAEEQTALMEKLADNALKPWERIRIEDKLKAIKDKMAGMAGDVVPALARIERQAMATFNAMTKNGVSFIDALNSLAPVLDAIVEKHKLMGTTASSAITELLKIRNVQKANEELFAAVEGNLAVMNALLNTGSMTQEIFSDSEGAMLDYYQKMMEAGLTQKQSLSQIAPTLERLRFMEEEYGYQIDDTTKHLIEQAEEQGLMSKKQLQTNDIMMAGFGEIIRALGGAVPEAFRESMKRVKEFGEEAASAAKEQARDVSLAAVQEAADALKKTTPPETPINITPVIKTDDLYEVLLQAGMTTKEAMAEVSSSTQAAVEDTIIKMSAITNPIDDMIARVVTATEAMNTLGKSINDLPTPSAEVNVSANGEDVIQAKEGGTWQMGSKSQLFRMHPGEVVKVAARGDDTGEIRKILSDLVIAIRAGSSKVEVNNEFNVSTIDADSFDAVIRKKIVPQLEAMSKRETFLTHPKSVRGY